MKKQSAAPLVVLALCMALQMTSFVLILPLFARRFSQLGAGVQALGESAMAYALAATSFGHVTTDEILPPLPPAVPLPGGYRLAGARSVFLGFFRV